MMAIEPEQEIITPEFLTFLQKHDSGIIRTLAREVERLRAELKKKQEINRALRSSKKKHACDWCEEEEKRAAGKL
jgi:hypothetical protein